MDKYPKTASKLHGLTPAQIRKAIYGDDKSCPVNGHKQPVKKSKKPEKSARPQQMGDMGLLLNLPFSTTATASLYKTPEWFTKTQKAEVSVIVPIYDTNAKYLIQSWDSSGLNVELIFVDDNCPRNSKDVVLKGWEGKRTQVGKIYTSAVTQGWGACCNIGAEKATAPILVFLHPSTVLTEGWLKPLVLAARRKEIGAASPLLLEMDARTISEAGYRWSWAKDRFLKVGSETYNGLDLSKPFMIDNSPADLLMAGEREMLGSYCMAIKKELFRSLGGFSSRVYSPEWADADLCMRLKDRGLMLISQGNSQVFREPVSSLLYREHGRVFFHNKWLTSGRIDSLVNDKRPTPMKEVESIVIRRRSAHGDVLLAAAVAAPLKQKYPKAQIIFNTDCPEVVQEHPYIDKVVEEYSERWFDLYFDLDMCYEERPDTNIMTAYAEEVGVHYIDCRYHMKTEAVEVPSKYVVIHAGKTQWVGRDWSENKFDIIAKRLQADGHKVVCVGTTTDHKTPCDLDLRGKTSVPQLGYIINKAELFVGIDSFPMHVAQIFGVPGVCFFGSIRPYSRLKAGSSIRPVIADGLKCLGCHHRRPTPCTSTTICEVGVQDCVNNVSADHVWKAICETWGS